MIAEPAPTSVLWMLLSPNKQNTVRKGQMDFEKNPWPFFYFPRLTRVRGAEPFVCNGLRILRANVTHGLCRRRMSPVRSETPPALLPSKRLCAVWSAPLPAPDAAFVTGRKRMRATFHRPPAGVTLPFSGIGRGKAAGCSRGKCHLDRPFHLEMLHRQIVILLSDVLNFFRSY